MPRLTFQRPRRIQWEERGPRFGRLVAEPFEKGYALTVGHSLRRALLSALPGAAIVWARVEGAVPESGAVPGIREDLTNLVLNLRQVVLRVPDDGPRTVRLEVPGPRMVRAGDLAAAGGLEAIEPDRPVATVEPGGRLVLEVGVRTGRGYVTADKHGEPPPPGAIPLDAAYSPVRRVNYAVEMSRLGKITDYEKLVLEIWTDGTITPERALLQVSALLRDHFDLFTPAGAEEDDEEPSTAGGGTRHE